MVHILKVLMVFKWMAFSYPIKEKSLNKQIFTRVLDWRERAPDGPARSKYDKIVIFKSLFDPKEFDVSMHINMCL